MEKIARKKKHSPWGGNQQRMLLSGGGAAIIAVFAVIVIVAAILPRGTPPKNESLAVAGGSPNPHDTATAAATPEKRVFLMRSRNLITG